MMKSAIAAALVVTAAIAIGCGGATSEDQKPVNKKFDPCSPVVLVAASNATAAEKASVADAAKLWNDLAGTAYTAEDDVGPNAPHIPVKFEKAADNFHGLYDDNQAVVFINQNIADDTERAVVIAHEVGHSLGLLHRSDVASVMNPDNTTTSPDEADKAALVKVWGDCSTTR